MPIQLEAPRSPSIPVDVPTPFAYGSFIAASDTVGWLCSLPENHIMEASHLQSIPTHL